MNVKFIKLYHNHVFPPILEISVIIQLLFGARCMPERAGDRLSSELVLEEVTLGYVS